MKCKYCNKKAKYNLYKIYDYPPTPAVIDKEWVYCCPKHTKEIEESNMRRIENADNQE